MRNHEKSPEQKARARALSAAWRAANTEKHRENSRAWHAANPEKRCAYNTALFAKGLCRCGSTVEGGRKACALCLEKKRADTARRRDRYHGAGLCRDCGKPAIAELSKCQPCQLRWRLCVIKSRYGLTHEQALAAACVEKCQVCGSAEQRKALLCVDHCHKTGAFRGVLCSNCNKSLGLLRDNPETLRKLADYLERVGSL